MNEKYEQKNSEVYVEKEITLVEKLSKLENSAIAINRNIKIDAPMNGPRRDEPERPLYD